MVAVPLLATVLLSLLAMAFPSGAAAQFANPQDQSREEYDAYYEDIQNKIDRLAPTCDTLSEGTKECKEAAETCQKAQWTRGCSEFAKFCQKNPACNSLVAPKPGNNQTLRFSAEWAVWLTKYWSASSYSGKEDALHTADEVQGIIWVSSFGLLGLFLTFSVIQYWASGMFNLANGTDLIAAPLRTLGAGLFIMVWPNVAFRLDVFGSDAVKGLLGRKGEQVGPALSSLNGLFHTSSAFAPVVPGPDWLPGLSDIIGFLVALAVALSVLSLSASKLALDFTDELLTTAIPLGAAVWVFPGMAWLGSTALRAWAAVKLIPFGWALALVVFSPMANGLVANAEGGSFVPSLAAPLVAVMLLLMLFAVMRNILQWGKLVPGGSRPLGSAWGAVLGGAFMGMQVATTGFRAARGIGRRIPWNRGPSQQRPPTASTGVVLGGGGGGGGFGGGMPGGGPPHGGPPPGGWNGPFGGGGPVHATATRPDRPDPNVGSWTPPAKGDQLLSGEPVQMRLHNGQPTFAASPVNQEYQASRNRLQDNGPPSRQTLEAARDSLPVADQAQLKAWAAFSHPERELAVRATQPMPPEHLKAYRTLLDGAHHNQSIATFKEVASQRPPTEQPK